MKHVCVALTACLSLMVMTRSRPVAEPYYDVDECKEGSCAIRLDDGFCRMFNTPCDREAINCQLQEKPWRLWDYTPDDSECIFVKRPNQVAICRSSCPVTNCYSTESACGANSVTSQCFVYSSLCKLKEEACKNPDIFNADMDRCARAGLRNPGDSGGC